MTPGDKTTIKMHPERSHYDKETIYGILDEGFVCHVAFLNDGQPFNIPMTYVRIGDSLYIHASRKSRLYDELRSGARTCVAVTLLDGIVLAKSAFNSSMNYRSVMIFGTMQEVEDKAEKMEIAEKLIEKMAPGRWEDCRKPSEEEFLVTGFLRMKIEEFSAKVRSGPPKDNPIDLKAPYWSGEIPILLEKGKPVPSSESKDKIGIPDYL